MLKKSSTDLLRTASKRAIQKTAEAKGDLIGNKLLIRLQVSQKDPPRSYIQRSCIQKNRYQIKLIMKYQEKDIYLYKKDRKLLVN